MSVPIKFNYHFSRPVYQLCRFWFSSQPGNIICSPTCFKLFSVLAIALLFSLPWIAPYCLITKPLHIFLFV